ncbi:MAG: Xaa-Pro dipeptidase [Gammaproteobacteria bacterium]|nr:MAG: Xaa-Pro dipeptidase [Gammaproteobacteria bacterium]
MTQNISELYSQHIDDLLLRHRKIMSEHNVDTLLIPSGVPLSIYLDDMNYPFKSSFLFRTYLPLTEVADSYLVIPKTGMPTLIYYQPIDFWHTPPSDPNDFWSPHFDIKIITQFEQALEFFPDNKDSTLLLGEHTQLTKKLNVITENNNSLINKIYWQRAYKSDYEIECLKQANRNATFAHKVAEEQFRLGKSELQIHLAYLEASGVLEHQLPYGNIVALNEHASILHYMECSANNVEQHQSFLIDAGVSFNGYHSDITRTYSYKNDEFADLVVAMNEMQLSCIDSIKNGQDYCDLHIDAHCKIAEIINQFGFVDMSASAMVESGISGAFFPHGLGHLIGLQVHDVGGQFADETGKPNPPPSEHPFLRSTRKMETSMAFTIEPGLYFIESLLKQYRNSGENSQHSSLFNWDKIESFMPYGGIRIEDDIIIEENGILNLTRDAFAEL